MSSELLNVKGFEIGNGKPMICVPVMAETKDEIVKLIRKYVADGVNMIEWRIDAFEDLGDVNKLRDVLEAVRALLDKTIFVYTYRSKEQGGGFGVDSISDIPFGKGYAMVGQEFDECLRSIVQLDYGLVLIRLFPLFRVRLEILSIVWQI